MISAICYSIIFFFPCQWFKLGTKACVNQSFNLIQFLVLWKLLNCFQLAYIILSSWKMPERLEVFVRIKLSEWCGVLLTLLWMSGFCYFISFNNSHNFCQRLWQKSSGRELFWVITSLLYPLWILNGRYLPPSDHLDEMHILLSHIS